MPRTFPLMLPTAALPIIARHLLTLLLTALAPFAPALAAGPASEAGRTLLVYGDSLSAGFGIATSDSWPALLDKRLKDAGQPWSVANASISGETSAGGRSRFAAALERFKPAIVILALGANDGLRGLPASALRDNLAAMVAAAKQRRAQVLLVGIRLPPNYGAEYTRDIEAVYAALAKREGLRLLPSLLDPIALDRGAFQADGLHPTAAVQGKLLEPVWTALQPLLKKAPK